MYSTVLRDRCNYRDNYATLVGRLALKIPPAACGSFKASGGGRAK